MVSTIRGDTSGSRSAGRGSRRWKYTLLLAFSAILTSTACSEDFLLSASSLEIGPDPARPGDAMVATVLVNLIPSQPHTFLFYVDGDEYLRVSEDGSPPVPVIIQLGDAAGLIDRYGTGTHSAHVEVFLDESGRSARTEAVDFVLQPADTGGQP